MRHQSRARANPQKKSPPYSDNHMPLGTGKEKTTQGWQEANQGKKPQRKKCHTRDEPTANKPKPCGILYAQVYNNRWLVVSSKC